MPRAVLYLGRAALQGAATAGTASASTSAVLHDQDRGGMHCARQCDALRLEQYDAHLRATATAPAPAPAPALHQLHHQCDLPDIARRHMVAWALHMELVKWWLMPGTPALC
eukprot:SAG31_NODE_11787_length_998_cov_1.794216_1_plen_110_part_10